MPHDSHQKGSVLCKRWKNQFCFQLCHLAIAATNNSFTEMEEKQRVVEMNYIDHPLLREFLYWLLFLRLRSRKGSKEKQGNWHSYTRNTRSSMSSFKSSRLEIQNNSFSRLGVRNKRIPSYITDLPKKAFKRVLRKLLFDILEKEDDYIQIHMIIKKVGT